MIIMELGRLEEEFEAIAEPVVVNVQKIAQEYLGYKESLELVLEMYETDGFDDIYNIGQYLMDNGMDMFRSHRSDFNDELDIIGEFGLNEAEELGYINDSGPVHDFLWSQVLSDYGEYLIDTHFHVHDLGANGWYLIEILN